MLGIYNNWNIINSNNKCISIGEFDEICRVLIDFISEKMVSLLNKGEYGTISKTYYTTMSYYIFKFLSEKLILQKKNTAHGQVFKAGER